MAQLLLGPLHGPHRRRTDAMAREAAPGGALRKRHHGVTRVQAGGDGGDYLGQLPQAGPLDRDHPHDARHHPHRDVARHVGAGDERHRRCTPPG